MAEFIFLGTVGVVTNDVLVNNPSGVILVTIRAIDSGNLYSETILKITIEDHNFLPQLFYKYTMEITQKVARQSTLPIGLWRQRNIVDKINKYFNAAIANLVRYIPLNNESFQMEWSVCNLPNSCTKDGLDVSAGMIFETATSTQVKQVFTAIFETQFSLDSIIRSSRAVTNGPQNPPVAKYLTLTLQLPFCGGFQYQFPTDLFTDVDQGNARSLNLSVEYEYGKYYCFEKTCLEKNFL